MRRFLKNNREVISYIFWGVMTTIVNWVSYGAYMSVLPKSSATIGTVVAWVITVLFAYVTNKLWVFENKSWKPAHCVPEFAKFTLCRVFSGVLETASMWLFVDHMGFDTEMFGVRGFVVKIIITVAVVVLNYIFSKLWIFKKKENT